MKRFLFIASVCSLLLACHATGGALVGTGETVTVPKDAPVTCANFCSDMGMSLGAVVVMANNVGCVCNPNKTATTEGKSASAAGGMAAIVIQQQEEEERSRQSSQHH